MDDPVMRWDVPLHPELWWEEDPVNGYWVKYDDHATALTEAQATIARLENLLARYANHVANQEGVDFLEYLLPVGFGSASIDGHPYHSNLTEAEAMEIRGYCAALSPGKGE